MASIAATIADINLAEAEFAKAHGIILVDLDDRAEAMDILNRIERRMLANMPSHEAAE
ncbi:MAG TPA: hypothetical protein VGH13_11630 [Xanthobacteraceae bacterium]|jgi:hypothetical protein